jgi:hypothetical protein
MLTHPSESAYEFPPALVHFVREHVTPTSGYLPEVTDADFVHLLTTIFFAGLDTYEGEHNPISVVFLGRSAVDFVMVEGTAFEAAPLYRWKILRFALPRPFEGRELVKLGVAGADRRMYTAVSVLDDGSLAITGLAREGVNTDRDPFIRIVASRPGCLSIRSGRDLAIDYERGVILTVGDEEVFAAGPVHDALRSIAQSAEVDDSVVPRYLDAVMFVVREIVAHGRGGILIVNPDEYPSGAELAPYRMVLDSSLGALLRMAWRVSGKKEFTGLLRNAFLTEAERVVEELGRLTAIDGAVLLNRTLALVAFGLILPVRQEVAILEGASSGPANARPVDFSSRGTRHRAAATYAAEHSGSVVFVVSEDGQVSCLLRQEHEAAVRRWRLSLGTARIA